MEQEKTDLTFARMLSLPPTAVAVVKGSSAYPELHGTVKLYATDRGTVVFAEIHGLPTPDGACESPIFGFHIHDGSACTGNESDPFADAGTHFNPSGCLHPYHAGDLPPLFGAEGIAILAVLTDRFDVEEVIGKAVVIHSSPDDFTTQPAGAAGEKMACGIITPTKR